jgi:coenzyme F420-0:L-glutamate ligase/coenzyme F420-1:gamma-L-glutamate ligase
MLCLNPLQKFPLIEERDDLARIIAESLEMNQIQLMDGDILVVTQKIVSKAEGQFVDLEEVEISKEATELAEFVEKSPGLVQVILNESNEIVKMRKGVLIAEHRLGFVCANAGVDRSNLSDDQTKEVALCLPVDPDASAKRIGQYLEQKTSTKLGILIIDSHGRAWRQGTVGISIGTYNVPMLVNKIGDVDMFGRVLKATVIAAADQLAATAALVMGEADEGTPVVHVRGFPYPFSNTSSIKDILREKEKDLFR